MIRGIGTSKGIGIGHALIIDEPQIEAMKQKSRHTGVHQ